MGFLLLPKTAERSRILGTEWLGYANCVSVFVLFRAAAAVLNYLNAQAVLGGEFFANLSSSAERGRVRRPPRELGKRKDNLRFSFLKRPFSLLPNLAQITDV